MTSAGASREGAVSVVIAVYNGEAMVAEAIGSAIEQGRIVGEIIVVDDGSTDDTVEVVRSFTNVRLLQQINAGPASARNTAIRASNCGFIAPLDHDDLFTPNRLDRMVAALESDPDAAYALGQQELVIEPGSPLPYWLRSTDPTELEHFRNKHGTGLMLIRRQAFNSVGYFDETLTGAGEDLDWVFRCIELGLSSVTIDDFVTVRRMRGDNLTCDESANRRAMFEVLQRRAHRRREQ